MSMKKWKLQQVWLPYVLLLPCMAFLTVFAFYPFLKSIYLSLTLTDMYGSPTKFVGWFNYVRLLGKPEFWNMMKTTMLFAVLVGTGTFLVAIVFALLAMDQCRGSKVYQIMYSLPMAIASVPAASMFIFLMSSNGIINRLLGVSIDWFGNAQWALIAISIVTIWSGTGASFLFLLVGFRNVPIELRESARIDGARMWSQTFKILLPLASPQIFFVIFLNIVGSFKAFAYFKLLTGSGVGGSTDVLIYQIYKQAFVHSRFETACTYAVILFLVIFAITRIQFAVEKKVVHYQ